MGDANQTLKFREFLGISTQPHEHWRKYKYIFGQDKFWAKIKHFSVGCSFEKPGAMAGVPWNCIGLCVISYTMVHISVQASLSR